MIYPAEQNGAVNRSRSERKRTPEMLATICKLVRKGLSVSHAAEKVHIHHTTIGRWRRENSTFDEALRAAEATFIEEQTANIRGAGKKNWQASAWLLERKWPQFFSQPQIQLHMGVGKKEEFEDFGKMLEKIRNSPETLRVLESMGESKLLALVQETGAEKLVDGKEIKPGESPSADQA